MKPGAVGMHKNVKRGVCFETTNVFRELFCGSLWDEMGWWPKENELRTEKG